MLFAESLAGALNSLYLHKKRTVLTMFGFSFGIAMVIVILSVGKFMGDVITVFYSGSGSGNSITLDISDQSGKSSPFLTEEICMKFNSELPDYIYGIDLSSGSDTDSFIINESVCYKCVLSGVSSASLYINQTIISSGRFISDTDCAESRTTAVISDVLAVQLYGSPDNALYDTIKIKTASGEMICCTVIGVYKAVKKGSLDIGGTVYIPYSTLNCLMSQEKRPRNSVKIAYSYGDMNKSRSIRYIYKYFNRIASDRIVNVYQSAALSEDEIRMVKMVTMLFILMSSAAFIVSGTGLTNMLLISVSERTKEIGIRKSIGAPDKSIKWQFLSESLIVCCLACGFGILIGYIANGILDNYTLSLVSILLDEKYSFILSSSDIALKPPSEALYLSVIISVVLGLAFGGYPAGKAVKMQPADALGYE